LHFSFGEYKTIVNISRELPVIQNITADFNNTLIIADENTKIIAEKICSGLDLPLCILKSGEENKNWQAVEEILLSATKSGLGRDCVFIAVGGGVIGDLAGFAASIYKRGCRLILIPTTLLAMVDASVGGKTGFDLYGIKNLAGSFYPAESVFMPLETLSSLPQKEWKSGLAELIKTAVLADGDFFNQLAHNRYKIENHDLDILKDCIEKAVLYKGSIVSEDPRESGKRMLLNLGHTFGHALESAAGLGNISHGEAVAWGIVRACELGIMLGKLPRERAVKIRDMITSFNYECKSPHPLAKDKDTLLNIMKSDKKKKQGKLIFIVPDENNAIPVTIDSENINILESILTCGLTI